MVSSVVVRGGRNSGWLVAFVAFFVSSFLLSGRAAPGLELDLSWQAVLEYAFEQNFQFGKDIIFTYGPLGFLNTFSSQGHLLPLRGAFAFAWSLSVAVSAVGIARFLSGAVRYLFVGWFLIYSYISYIGHMEQHVYLVVAYGAMALLFVVRGRNWFLIGGWLPACVVLSLIKFTFLLAACGTVVICFFILIWQKQTARAFAILFGFVIMFLLGWWGIGQDLGNLPAWMKGSLAISSGYNQAMSIFPQVKVFCAAAGALLFFLLAAALVLMSRPFHPPAGGMVLIVALVTYLTWKHGFVRADDHVYLFLLSFPLLFSLLFIEPLQRAASPRVRFIAVSCFVGALALCLVGLEFQEEGGILARARNGTSRVDRVKILWDVVVGRAESHFVVLAKPTPDREPDLPRTRSLVGNAPIDVINYGQWAALANGLTYRPRPIIQGYSAYTPYLQDLNQQRFLGPQQPAFLLFNQETIDNRFPTLDDGEALVTVINNYLPVAREGIFLLLRAAGTALLELKSVHHQELRFGERLDLAPWNQEPLFMSVDLQPTLFGHLVTLLFQQPPLFLEIETATSRFQKRFVPIMGRKPFLVSPYLKGTDDVLDLYLERPGERVRSFVFERPRKKLFGQLPTTFCITLYRSPGFPRAASQIGDRAQIELLKRPAFSPAPMHTESSNLVEDIEFHGLPGLLVPPPGSVEVEVPPNATSFSGYLGLVSGAYSKTDGVEFVIEAVNESGQRRRLFFRFVQPKRQEGDRGKLAFSVEIDSKRDKTLILTTGVGPAGSGKSDHSVWADCHFTSGKGGR